MATEIFDPTRVTDDAEYSLHTLLFDEGVRGYVYVQAMGAISVGAVCSIEHAGQADELDSASTDLYGSMLGVAQTAMTDNDYGWLQVYGPCAAIQVTATVAKGNDLFGTTTDGGISSTSTAAFIKGINVAARTGAGNTSGILAFPLVQAT